MGGADSLVQLDAAAVAKRVVDPVEEGQLAREELERFRVAALQRGEVAQAHVGPHDHHPVLARLHLLLEGGRPPGRVLAPREVAHQRRAVRELQGRPAGLRVEAQGRLVLGGRVGPAGLA
ncbi:MAG: hypothetical protein E6J87_23105, partial [Deltaproteobacteria bacterium]